MIIHTNAVVVNAQELHCCLEKHEGPVFIVLEDGRLFINNERHLAVCCRVNKDVDCFAEIPDAGDLRDELRYLHGDVEIIFFNDETLMLEPLRNPAPWGHTYNGDY